MTSGTIYLLYFIFALGGAGVYLLLPKADRSQMLAGGVIAALSLIGLLAVLAVRVILPDETTGYFYLFSAVAVSAAARVITHPKPVYSALYFVLVAIAVAALLVLQEAEFLAVALIIIYAGAILVTYLFVIMLAQQSGSPVYDRRCREPFMAVLAGFVLTAAIAARAGDLPQRAAPPAVPTQLRASKKTSFPLRAATVRERFHRGRDPLPYGRASVLLEAPGTFDATGGAAPSGPGKTALGQDRGSGSSFSNTTAIGAAVMTRYVVVLEIAGVLLLVSMIGAIALSRKKVPVEGVTAAAKPLGQVGREVEPY